MGFDWSYLSSITEQGGQSNLTASQRQLLLLLLSNVDWTNFHNGGQSLVASERDAIQALLAATQVALNVEANPTMPVNHQQIFHWIPEDWYGTTSPVFADIDAVDLSITITTSGNPLLVHFSGSFQKGYTTSRMGFDIALDGVRVGAAHSHGIMHSWGFQYALWHTFSIVLDLPAGTYTLRPQWCIFDGGPLWLDALEERPVFFEVLEL